MDDENKKCYDCISKNVCAIHKGIREALYSLGKMDDGKHIKTDILFPFINSYAQHCNHYIFNKGVL